MALAVDLVEEYDGDDVYPQRCCDAHAATDKPVVVLTNVAAAVDQAQAALLRGRESRCWRAPRSGLRALGHLLDAARPAAVGRGRSTRRPRRRDDRRGSTPTTSLDGCPAYGIARAT